MTTEELMPTNAELKALEAHKSDMDEMTYYRYRQRLPIQIERLKRLPLLARAIADEAERIAKESTAPAKTSKEEQTEC